ncbi:MAG: nucleotidyl transferase AbiEii/AbiGii toxin family protein [Flavobacteriaceae bacterium]|nr:nucleotidyl transferase AbiEii/AbiGii toxin family protein [Flavobacteriaceae bacterium]MCY4298585.1 nucleotidyl transferase AbiEii/AbiGii toxin family protein [Flavobacteriaceae bacterium]
MDYKQIHINTCHILLEILPIIMEEECLALHGGTAINLFMLDLPRLSIDIDLTYVPLDDKRKSIETIHESSKRICNKINQLKKSNLTASHNPRKFKIHTVNQYGISVKTEIRLFNRGIMNPCIERKLSPKAQETFNTSCSVRIVPQEQLYGGKICAALFRQSARDLFDICSFFKHLSFDDQIKKGFFYGLLSSSNPVTTFLNPKYHKVTKEDLEILNDMTPIPFNEILHKKTLTKLITDVNDRLTKKDKEFLIRFNIGEPDWSINDWKDYPAIQWKLKHILKLKNNKKRYNTRINHILSVLKYPMEDFLNLKRHS